MCGKSPMLAWEGRLRGGAEWDFEIAQNLLKINLPPLSRLP